MVFHQQLRRLTGRISSAGRRLQRSQFFADTSLHGFGHFVKAEQKGRAIFWLIVPTIAIFYCGYQVSIEVINLIENDRQVSFLGLGKNEDIRLLPNISLCYSHWLFYLDWEKAYKMNLTKEEIFVLMSHMYTNVGVNCITSCDKLDRAAKTVTEKFKLKMNYSTFHELIYELTFDPGLTNIMSIGSSNIEVIPPRVFSEMDSGLSRYCIEIVSKYFIAPEYMIDESILEPLLNYKVNYPIMINNHVYNFTVDEKVYFNDIFNHNALGTLFIDGTFILEIPSNAASLRVNLKSSITVYQKPVKQYYQCVPDFNDIYRSKNLLENDHPQKIKFKSTLCQECKTFTFANLDDYYKLNSSYYHQSSQYTKTIKEWKPYYDDKSMFRCAVHSVQLAGGFSETWSLSKYSSRANQSSTRFLYFMFTLDDPKSWFLVEYKREVTLNGVLANIGGTLGIWTGASILSILHVIDYFFSIIPYKRIFKILQQKIKVKVTVVKVHRI